MKRFLLICGAVIGTALGVGMSPGPTGGFTQSGVWFEVSPYNCPEGQVCDIGVALTDALDQCNAMTHASPRSGCNFHIAAGEYSIGEPVVLCRQHVIFGDGGRHRGANTVIWSEGENGIFVVGSNSECRNDNPRQPVNGVLNIPSGGNMTLLRDFALKAPPCLEGEPHNCTHVPNVAVDVNEPVEIERLFINGFGIGILISADVTRPVCAPGSTGECHSNANLWSVTQTRIEQSDHAGILVRGGDSNAGATFMLDSSASCRFTAPYEVEYGECANVVDKSFLGNTWLATHTALGPDEVGQYVGYLVEGASQRTVLVGAYAEHSSLPSELSANSLSLGGISGWADDIAGLRLSGNVATGRVSFVNRRDPNNVTTTRLGNFEPGVYMSLGAERARSAWPFRWRQVNVSIPGVAGCEEASTLCTEYSQVLPSGASCSACTRSRFVGDVANLGAARAFEIDGGQPGIGTLRLPSLEE